MVTATQRLPCGLLKLSLFTRFLHNCGACVYAMYGRSVMLRIRNMKYIRFAGSYIMNGTGYGPSHV